MNTETMALVNAILDFLKALIWPATVLVIVFMFRSYVERILNRLLVATKVKFGAYEASWTLDQVAKDLSQSSDPQISQSKLQVLAEERGWHALSDPMTDVIALKLWRQNAGAEQLAREALEPTRLSGEQFSPGFMYHYTLRVKKILDTLQALHYVDAIGDKYELTPTGRTIFKEVVEHESEIL